MNRDLDSIKRDMDACIKHVVGRFKESGVALEAEPIATLATVMFNDYRQNTPRDITEMELVAMATMDAHSEE